MTVEVDQLTAVEPTSLSGRVAIVTGGASGIGAATSVRLASLGASVMIVDRDRANAERVAAQVDGLGRSSLVHVTELADTDALPAVPQVAFDHFGRVDILVNAAGVSTPGTILETSLEDWQWVHSVNLTASFVLLKAVARLLVEQGDGGAVVNVSSSSAFRTMFAKPSYASSKSALIGLTRSAAGDLGRYAITVNVVVPGVTETPMVLSEYGGDREAIARAMMEGPLANVLGRPAEPRDIANVIAFLCSPASRHVTGQTVHVSAGSVV